MKEIVIKLHDMEYEEIVNDEACGLHTLTRAVANGKVLPKGHGRLIDVDKVDWQAGVFLGYDGEPLPVIHKIATIEMLRDWQDAVVEADKGEE